MKKYNKYIVLYVFTILFLSSCDRAFLEPWPPDAARTPEDVWGNYSYSKGFLDAIYADQIMSPYVNDITGNGMLASATDEAEHSLPSAGVQDFTNGVWNPTNVPEVLFGGPWVSSRTWRSPWYNAYLGIRRANIFLVGVNNSVLIDDPNDPTRSKERTYFKGQAYFWRAFLQFQLLRNYGSFPITTQVEIIEGDIYKERNTMDECVNQIVKDCNSAIDSLPLLWDEANWHRINRTAAMALKSRVLLYYASPLYQGPFATYGTPANTIGDVKRWVDAADAARIAVNENSFYDIPKVTKTTRPFSSAGAYNYIISLLGNLENKEIIFSTGKTTQYSIQNEYHNLPAGVEGCNGYTNPTQEMVDAFEVVTGTGTSRQAVPFDWNNPVHAKAPYDNRDNRFYNVILYNGYLWGTTTSRAYYIDTYVGGKHRDPMLPNSTKTGYYYKKFLSESVYSYKSGDYTAPSRVRHEFRFAELILNYAEAMNEAYGPYVIDPKGALRIGNINTAKAAIDAIRARVDMPALPLGLS